MWFFLIFSCNCFFTDIHVSDFYFCFWVCFFVSIIYLGWSLIHSTLACTRYIALDHLWSWNCCSRHACIFAICTNMCCQTGTTCILISTKTGYIPITIWLRNWMFYPLIVIVVHINWSLIQFYMVLRCFRTIKSKLLNVELQCCKVCNIYKLLFDLFVKTICVIYGTALIYLLVTQIKSFLIN